MNDFFSAVVQIYFNHKMGMKCKVWWNIFVANHSKLSLSIHLKVSMTHHAIQRGVKYITRNNILGSVNICLVLLLKTGKLTNFPIHEKIIKLRSNLRC